MLYLIIALSVIYLTAMFLHKKNKSCMDGGYKHSWGKWEQIDYRRAKSTCKTCGLFRIHEV